LFEHEKARQLSRRRAWHLPDLDGRLIQAMAVRRHGGPMMMVVTVMAVALHLLKKLRENPLSCQIRHFQSRGSPLNQPSPLLIHRALCLFRLQWEFLLPQQIDNMLVQAIAQLEPLRCARHIAHLNVDIGS
jgi:hypothetical protein